MLTLPTGTHPILAAIDGALAPDTNVRTAGGESDLDFELAFPIVYPQTITLCTSIPRNKRNLLKHC
jgi:tripeptidyl-peptidase-1